MAKDLVMRRCSHCGHNGHNTRTCNGKGCVKLFGVNIEKPDDNLNDRTESIRRTKSAGSLSSLAAESSTAVTSGYHSDADDKKKGRLWTEEEHRSFLMGLEKLGKGDWKGISKFYVPTRSSTQVASHAQKYFIRMATMEKKKRRTSVFDVGINEVNADSTSPEQLSYNESNSESLSMPSLSNQAIIPFENLAHKKSVETTTHMVSSSERPPLSPSMRYTLALNYPSMPYMIGPASSNSPAFSYVPMTNFPVAPSNLVYLPLAYNNAELASYARPRMVVQPSSGCAFPHQAEPPPDTAASTNRKNGLDLSLGSLRL